jgi:benzodiazapine receptor
VSSVGADISPVIPAVCWALVLGAGGAWLTRLDAWYYGLRFPGWKPPDWAFGPAWTTIFACAAWAFVRAWSAPGMTPGLRTAMIVAYLANGALNSWWSYLFFRRHRPDWALVETVVLWISILAMLVVIGLASPLSAWLIAPYLAWVTLAGFLTRAVVRLNGPFTA